MEVKQASLTRDALRSNETFTISLIRGNQIYVMTDSLSVDMLPSTDVVHGDALTVPAGQACPLDGDRILRAGDASMLSYQRCAKNCFLSSLAQAAWMVFFQSL